MDDAIDTTNLEGWINTTIHRHNQDDFNEFQKMGFLVYGTIYFQVVIPFDKHDTHFYREEWYHTLGDSDLI